MTINKTETVTLPAVEVCDSYVWHGVTYTTSGNYTYTEGCRTEVLPLTINKMETVTLPAVEACDSYVWHGVTYTTSGTYTYNTTTDKGCERVETLYLTIYAISDDVVEDYTICSGESLTWNGADYAEAGTYTVTLNNENGCPYEATLNLYIADADNDPAYNDLKAISKYGDRLLLLHLNELKQLADAGVIPGVPSENDVTWYRAKGERDKIAEIINGTAVEPDEKLPNNAAYYYNNVDGSPLEAGLYYALMKLPGAQCATYLRTATIEVGAAVAPAPQLVPTITSPAGELRLLNLNPSSVNEVRVYNTTGDVIAIYTAAQASEFIFKAATLPGYYMVEVQSNGEQTTLRYIVK